MRKASLSLLLLAAAVLTGCANSGTGMAPPRTVKTVDLKRYQGTWYEVARLPMYFQRECVAAEAQYALQDDGSLSISNRCLTRRGSWRQANGRALPQVAGKANKLWVSFDSWFSRLFPGEYWVLELDSNYQTALVGSPNHHYLWLLARTPQLSAERREELLSVARSQGYDTTKLIWRETAEVPR
jgi:apolipoprotein D and lipocalin family protein